MSQYFLPYIEVDLTNRCNFNCARCSHFSPLANANIMDYDFDTFVSDMKELSKKFVVGTIRLMGGEPLLIPNLLDYAKVTRECFYYAKISIVSNGILQDVIDKLSPELEKLNIFIAVSDHIGRMSSNSTNVHVRPYTSFRGLDLSEAPIYDGKVSKAYCNPKTCVSMYMGRIYYCPVMKNLATLEKAFNLNFKLPEEERSIDLYNLSSEEILKQLYDVQY